MKDKKYLCECVKEFTNSQCFNGHKSHCKIHLAAIGRLDAYSARQAIACKAAQLANIARHKIQQEAKIATWVSEKHKCEHCGKIMTEKFGSGRFCCRSCANSRKHSVDTISKISKSLKISLKKAWNRHPEYWLNSIDFSQKTEIKTCEVCGKELNRSNVTGLCQTCLRTTEKGKQVLHNSGIKGYATKKANSSHRPWQSRNITSYAEKFWIKILDNNNIQYQRELAVKHEKSNYFLDFYIEINGIKLDLEIDGKQHKYKDRKGSDEKRDAFLTSLGYTVYRIDWNSINSIEGKAKMKNKINRFLKFYKKIVKNQKL